MKTLAAIVLLCITLGVGASLQAQTAGSAGGPYYFASLYGVKCDSVTDDTAALKTLAATVSQNGNVGGTIVLPPTGHGCRIDSPFGAWPANVNLQGCGMYGSPLTLYPTAPPCGLQLDSKDLPAKISFTDFGQVIFRDLAILDPNPDECSGAPPSGYPFFLITNTIVRFENVSVQGSSARLTACNDVFILGSSPCQAKVTCFGGFGSTFHNLYFSQVRRIALFNSDANGTDWDSIAGDAYNGNGTSLTGSAIEINCITDHPCYGNVFKNIAVEQGPFEGDTLNYQYALSVLANVGPNFVFGITCSDVPKTNQKPCVHIGSRSSGVLPQMVLGCSTSADRLDFPGCVSSENIDSYGDIVADLFNAAPTFSAQTIYGANLGSRDPVRQWNYLYLYDLDLVPTTKSNLPFHTPLHILFRA